MLIRGSVDKKIAGTGFIVCSKASAFLTKPVSALSAEMRFPFYAISSCVSSFSPRDELSPETENIFSTRSTMPDSLQRA